MKGERQARADPFPSGRRSRLDLGRGHGAGSGHRAVHGFGRGQGRPGRAPRGGAEGGGCGHRSPGRFCGLRRYPVQGRAQGRCQGSGTVRADYYPGQQRRDSFEEACLGDERSRVPRCAQDPRPGFPRAHARRAARNAATQSRLADLYRFHGRCVRGSQCVGLQGCQERLSRHGAPPGNRGVACRRARQRHRTRLD